MALCLPRSRRATSLATRPRTLSVASITNHSCFTSAGLALNVLVMSFLCKELVWLALFHGRTFSAGRLLGGMTCSAAGPKNAAKLSIVRKITGTSQVLPIPCCRTVPSSHHVQLPPRLPRRQPRGCAQAHRVDRHPAPPDAQGGRHHLRGHACRRRSVPPGQRF